MRIGDLSVERGFPCADTVKDFGFFRIFLPDQFVIGTRIEVAVIVQPVVHELNPEVGLDGRYQDRVLGELFVEPVSQSALFVGIKVVVCPQADGKRRPQIGTVQRVVGRYGQGAPHGGFRRSGNLRAGIGLDVDFPDAGIERFVVGQPSGRGTCGRQYAKRAYDQQTGNMSIHGCRLKGFRFGNRHFSAGCARGGTNR